MSLTDTKTAVDQIHTLLNVLVAILILIIWLIMLRVPITHFLVFISSQLLLVVYLFGNTCKTVFEAIIFLFVIHPFDVGDRCEVDGVMVRKEAFNKMFIMHSHISIYLSFVFELMFPWVSDGSRRDEHTNYSFSEI